MKAAVMEGLHQPLVVRDVPVPPIGPRDVLVRVKGAGVCHSDVHHVDGSAGDITISKFPHILGHEVTGQVDKMGSDVTHLQVGDRVGVSHMFACGRCPNCLSGEEEVCDTLFSDDAYIGGVTADGGYAEYMRVPANFALPLPEELDYVEAAPLFCAGLSVYAALKCAHIKPGQRAAILGVGGLGHMAIPIARAMGAEVIAITSSDWKVALSKELGAAQVISGNGDIGQKLRAAGGADVVVSTTIDTKAIVNVMGGLSPNGALVLTGLTLEPLPIVPERLIFGQQRILASRAGSRLDLHELMQLSVQNNIRPLTETFPLDEVNQAHDRVRSNQVRFRAVLTPG